MSVCVARCVCERMWLHLEVLGGELEGRGLELDHLVHPPATRPRGEDQGARGITRHFAGRRSVTRRFAGGRSVTKHFAGGRSVTRHFAGRRSVTKHFAGRRSVTRHFAGRRSVTKHFAGGRSVPLLSRLGEGQGAREQQEWVAREGRAGARKGRER